MRGVSERACLQKGSAADSPVALCPCSCSPEVPAGSPKTLKPYHRAGTALLIATDSDGGLGADTRGGLGERGARAGQRGARGRRLRGETSVRGLPGALFPFPGWSKGAFCTARTWKGDSEVVESSHGDVYR